jgi:hypothetical protein
MRSLTEPTGVFIPSQADRGFPENELAGLVASTLGVGRSV